MDVVSYWKNRWAEKKTGWHKLEPNSLLVKFSDNLDVTSPKRVFVPLCGKSLDLMWFYEKGHEVVGVEGVEEAIKEFFEEQKLPFNIQELPWAKVYQTEDKRLKIYFCNLFDIVSKEMGKFDRVWDRGSLVAIYMEDRERYVKLLIKLLAPDFKYLLSTLQYDGVDINGGPPRCIPHELTDKLFGESCKIEVLSKTEVSDERSRTVWALKECWESVHLLTPK